ncbi:hypothetical protein MED297_07986 [Reinekea sp. MED297]|uniref:Uncharacterized protein n=2 Tax=Reinekea TaxID=230494 RepID=A4BCT0_9GAMM|nr:hypothetical protein MED297_07986 [Reinekea sp. MED297] [Reinekea blandensis MED297]
MLKGYSIKEDFRIEKFSDIEHIEHIVEDREYHISYSQVEKFLTPDLKPDVTLSFVDSDYPLGVEIYVSHKSDKRKIKKGNDQNAWLVEIDISSFIKNKGWTNEDFEKAVLRETERQTYLSHPEKEKIAAELRKRAKENLIKERLRRKERAKDSLSSFYPLNEKYKINSPGQNQKSIFEGKEKKAKGVISSSRDIVFVINHMTGKRTIYRNSNPKIRDPAVENWKKALIDYNRPLDVLTRLGFEDISHCFRYWGSPPFYTIVTMVYLVYKRELLSVDEFNQAWEDMLMKNDLVVPDFSKFDEFKMLSSKIQVEVLELEEAPLIVFDRLMKNWDRINQELKLRGVISDET